MREGAAVAQLADDRLDEPVGLDHSAVGDRGEGRGGGGDGSRRARAVARDGGDGEKRNEEKERARGACGAEHRCPVKHGCRAEDWARLRFDQRLARALGTTPADVALLDVAEAEGLVAGYVETIGDIEQSMPGEQSDRDVLIGRHAAQTATHRIEADASRDAPTSPGRRHDAGPDPQPQAAHGIAAECGANADRIREINTWLANWMAQAFEIPAAGISPADRFGDFGMDSVRAVMLINALEEWLGLELPPTLTWDTPRLGEMANHLAGLLSRNGDARPHIRFGDSPALKVDGRAPIESDIALLAQVDQLSPDELTSLLAQFPKAD